MLEPLHLDVAGLIRRGVDAPVRTSLELSRRTWLHQLAPGLAGTALLAGATLLSSAIAGRARDPDALSALGQALAVVVPAATIVVSARVSRMPFGAWISSLSLGALHAGLVAALFVPLVLLLTFTAGRELAAHLGIRHLVPFVGCWAGLLVPSRALTTLDRSFLSKVVASGLSFFVLGLFLYRLSNMGGLFR
ncbi:MAG: hypothetical protein QM723_20805 [Myxococcaceae bacterium]